MQHRTNGILIIDKPADITSARVVSRVKKIPGVKKAGHGGTLDPFATGVLVCCLNQATKLARFFLNEDKKYEAVLNLGVCTDTQDATGVVKSTCSRLELSEKKIKSVFKEYLGPIDQLPPVYSALKHKGVPLYKLARNGKPVQKPARRIFISSIKIIDIYLPFVSFEVECSAGTYIRTLCSDIGESLGCGGHLKDLRRTRCGRFTIEEAVDLSELEVSGLSSGLSGRMVSMTDALGNMDEYVADEILIKKLTHGNTITKKEIPWDKPDTGKEFFKIIDNKRALIAVLKHTTGKDRYSYCCVFSNLNRQ